VIEVNPRASRTVPFLSKARGIPFVNLAVGSILGKPLPKSLSGMNSPTYYYLKAPVFSNENLGIKSCKLGPEMKSTGEIMTVGKTPIEAIAKATMYNQAKVVIPKRDGWGIVSEINPNVDIYKLQK
jgi:carbamoyl-phosphate synthase large subunit